MKFSRLALTIFNDFIHSSNSSFSFMNPFIDYFSIIFEKKDFNEYLVPKVLSLDAEEYAYLMLALEWESIVAPNNAESLIKNMQHYFSGIRLSSTEKNTFLFDGELFIFLILYLLLDNYRDASCCDSFVLSKIDTLCDKIGVLIFSEYITKVNSYGVKPTDAFILEINNGICFNFVSLNEEQTAIINKIPIVVFPSVVSDARDCIITIGAFLSHHFKLPII